MQIILPTYCVDKHAILLPLLFAILFCTFFLSLSIPSFAKSSKREKRERKRGGIQRRTKHRDKARKVSYPIIGAYAMSPWPCSGHLFNQQANCVVYNASRTGEISAIGHIDQSPVCPVMRLNISDAAAGINYHQIIAVV